MLGISRPSVREALRVLTAMNVVEPRHGGGTYVTSLDPTLLAQPINFLLQVEPHTFLHLFEVRQVLEVSAARLAAPKMTEDGLAELQSLVDQAAAAMRQPNRYSELDFQLHTKIVEAMENPIYLSLYQSISDLLLESRRRTAAIATVRRQAHQDHLAIVGALRARDPEAAAQAMQVHLETVRRVLDDMLAPQVRPVTSAPPPLRNLTGHFVSPPGCYARKEAQYKRGQFDPAPWRARGPRKRPIKVPTNKQKTKPGKDRKEEEQMIRQAFRLGTVALATGAVLAAGVSPAVASPKAASVKAHDAASTPYTIYLSNNFVGNDWRSRWKRKLPWPPGWHPSRAR